MDSEQPAAQSSPRARRIGFAAAGFALVALKLWLVAWQDVGADGSARFDDALFVELAQHLRSGNWLGPYTERTLVKGPVYPIWLSISSALGLPMLPSQQVFHALAAAAIAVSLRRAVPNPWARFALFAVLLFDPATYESTSMRVSREGIYPALAMFIVAGLIEIAPRTKMRAAALAIWGVALGLVLGAFWLTREEGPWIVPAVAIVLGYATVRTIRAQRGPQRLTGAGIVLIPLVVALVSSAAVAAINYRHYGVACVTEFKAKWFERGYGAVTRVAPENYAQWVPLTEESRLLAYEVSPSFAELRPYLDGTGADRDEFSLSRFGEMTGTWFIWAFREAANSAGHHDSLPEARDYYLRIADEVNAACAAGSVPCGPSRASLAPPWRPEYLGEYARAVGKLAHIVLSMEQVEIEQMPSLGGPELLAPFADMANQRVEGVDEPSRPRGVVRQEALRAVRDVYAIVAYPATIAAILILIAVTTLALRRRSLPPMLVVAWAILAAIGARLALLAYISVSSYPIYQGLYLRVLYPLVYVFVFLAIVCVVTEWKARAAKS